MAQQLRETELVNRVTRHAVSFDVNQALMEICRDLAAYFQVEQTGIALLSQDRQSLTVVADHSPENATSVVGYVIPVEGNPSTEIVLETRRPAAFSDAQNDPRLASIRDLMVARKTVSILIAPLFVRDEIIGTVGIDSFTTREFTASDIALLEQVANAVSTALENARLYNTAQQELAERTRVEQQMRQRNLELEALNRVAGTMMMNVPLETSLAQMARELVNTFRARNCGIALLNAERDALTVVADALPLGHPQQSVGIVIPIAGNASSEYVVQNKISLVVDDPQTNPLTQSIHERMRDRNMTCLAIIPLLSGEQVIGTIGLDTTEPGRVFSADEVHVAETMASQMASAIEKQRLLEATQREVIQRTRAERIQVALFRIADAANIAETTPEFYAILHEVIAEVVYAPNMYVALYHPAEDALEFAYFKDEHDELAAPFRRRSPAGKSITAWVIKQGQPLLGDAETFTLMQARGEVEMRGNPPVEWLGIPLKRGGETFGMFTVQSYSTEHVYAAHDLELLLTLAPEIANAITRREEQEALVRRNRELAVLNRVTQVASTGMELSDTLGTVAREMVDIFQARNCGIALLTPEQTELVVVASATRSPDEPNTVGVRIPVQNNPSTERVLETRASLVIENAQTDPLTARIHALMRERNTQALMIVPLLSGGQIIGTVGLDLTEPERMFAPEDVRLAETIANQMANAVEKQHLFEQTQSALQQTQDALAQVNQAQNRLALQFQTAQLLAGASSFDEVSSPLLESICRALNWQVGEFWTINEENATATLQHVWSTHEPELHAFTRGAVGSTYPRGEGLVGETWAARAPVWIENLQTDARFKDPALAIRAGLVTAFGFPVVSDTHAFGIATFFSKQHQVLDEALMATMSGVGSQIVQFLQRREAEEFVRQQNTFLMAMHDMTIGLMRRVNLDEVLESIIARAAELVRTEHGYVHLVEPGGVELRMRVGVGLYQDFIGTRVKRGQGLAGTVWQSGAPLVVEDYQKYPGRLPMVDRDVLRAVVGVPLMSGDQIAGVLGLASLTEGRVFTRAQVEALKRFAELASVAIDNARLHESTQTALDQTRRAAEREKASSEIAERLYAEPDIKYVLQTAADELRRATGSKRATVRIKLGSNGEAALTNAPAPNGDE